jgi:hypothetical protein
MMMMVLSLTQKVGVFILLDMRWPIIQLISTHDRISTIKEVCPQSMDRQLPAPFWGLSGYSWVTCVWVLAAIAVDVPSASVVVVAIAIKTRIDIFLAVVFMLT